VKECYYGSWVQCYRQRMLYSEGVLLWVLHAAVASQSCTVSSRHPCHPKLKFTCTMSAKTPHKHANPPGQQPLRLYHMLLLMKTKWPCYLLVIVDLNLYLN